MNFVDFYEVESEFGSKLLKFCALFVCLFTVSTGYSRIGRQEPDTIVIRGVPSRWFAEPRVSSKPSMLVTHTIFSTFGRIRHVFMSMSFIFL